MRIKKLLICSLPILALALAVTVGGSFLHTPEAEAGDFCLPTVHTANSWAMAPTCTAARNACASDVVNIAETACSYRDVCNTQPITYNNCRPAGNQFKVDCSMKYGCTAPF